MRRLVATALVALACSRPDAEPVREVTPAPPPQLNIRLESPRQGDLIRDNPIEVSGQARTFENNVVIRLLDSDKELMVETYTTAFGEIGSFNPFSRQVFLTRMPGSELTVQAFDYSAKDGSIQDLNSVTLRAELRPRTVTLYFPSTKRSPKDCARVFAVTREVPASVSLARLLVEALLAGPTPGEKADGYDGPFPRGAQVRSVNLRAGVLTADFNQRLGNVGGSCRAQAIRASLERTLRELPNVVRVRITALGDEKTALQP